MKKEWKVFFYGKEYINSTVPLTGSAVQSHETRMNIELGDSTFMTSTALESSAVALRSPQPRGGGAESLAQPMVHEDSTVDMIESEFDHDHDQDPAGLSRESGMDDLRFGPTLSAMLETEGDDV